MTTSEICDRETSIVHCDGTAMEAARLMRQHHVGDVVVGEDGNDGARIPVGIVPQDDVLELLPEERLALSRLVKQEQNPEIMKGR